MKPLMKIGVRAAWDAHYQMWKVMKLIGGIWQKAGTQAILYHSKVEADKVARNMAKQNPEVYDYRG